MTLLFTLLVSIRSAEGSSSFGDPDFLAMVGRTGHGGYPAILYGWSPHMPLSVRGLEQLLVYVAKRKVSIVPILDPGASERLALEVATSRKWPKAFLKRATSARLFRLGFRTHYPTYLFVNSGKLATNILPGYKTPGALAPYLRKYL